MDEMLVVIFNNERRAYEGLRELKDLHAEGSITLYGHAVLAKDAGGTVRTKEEADRGPLGTAVGIVTGSLIGLIGGPVGMAAGAAAGATGGALYDFTGLSVGLDFLDEVARRLEPGAVAVVAEIEEDWVTPVDTRMEALDGVVFRRAIGEVVDAQMTRDATAFKADIARLQAEQAQASGAAKTKLQAKIDAAKTNLRATHRRVQERENAAAREREAKLAALQAQAAQAHAERKQQLAKRAADVQADYTARSAKLHQAAELAKEAMTPS